MIGIDTVEAALVGKVYEIRWDNQRTWSAEKIESYDFSVYDSRLQKIAPRRMKTITSGTTCVVLKHKHSKAFLLVGEDIIALDHNEPGFELFPVTEG
jgi:hypothetical protein